MNIKPYADRVVVEPIERDSMLPSGLVLPENAQGKPQEGIVVAVGFGHWSDPMGRSIKIALEVGDKVLFAKYSGTEVELEGKKHLILNERDILAVLSEGETK